MTPIRGTDPMVVTFHPHPDSGYGTLTLSWEDKPRRQLVTLEAAKKVAEGWKAEFNVEAGW